MRAFWFWVLEGRWDERWRGIDVLIREDYCCNLEVDFFPAMLICPVTYGKCNVRQNCRADPGFKAPLGMQLRTSSHWTPLGLNPHFSLPIQAKAPILTARSSLRDILPSCPSQTKLSRRSASPSSLPASPTPNSLQQLVEEIESRAIQAQQQINVVKAQISSKQRDARLLQLTSSEIGSLPSGTKVYEGVGKMYVTYSPLPFPSPPVYASA